MSKNVLFSIITATYNSALTVRKTLQSVVGQRYRDFEIIIIDGNSTDETLSIVQEYQENISVVISEKDEGIYDAFNKGVKNSSGKYIYFLNSDDYFIDEYVLEDISKEIDACEENLDFIYGNVEVYSSNGEFVYRAGKPTTIKDFQMGQTYPHQGFIAGRHLFEKYNYFDLNYSLVADLDFMVKCFKDVKLKGQYLDRSITVFTQGGASNDFSNRQVAVHETKRVLENHFGIKDRKKYPDVNVLYRKWFELNLLHDKGLSNELVLSGYKKIAIFGAMKTGVYFYKDCQKYSQEIEVLSFLDNNINLEKSFIDQISINTPLWLENHIQKLDAIVVTIEGDYFEEICQQIQDISKGQYQIQLINWKELLV